MGSEQARRTSHEATWQGGKASRLIRQLFTPLKQRILNYQRYSRHSPKDADGDAECKAEEGRFAIAAQSLGSDYSSP
jgi:hypothetical protein